MGCPLVSATVTSGAAKLAVDMFSSDPPLDLSRL